MIKFVLGTQIMGLLKGHFLEKERKTRIEEYRTQYRDISDHLCGRAQSVHDAERHGRQCGR